MQIYIHISAIVALKYIVTAKQASHGEKERGDEKGRDRERRDQHEEKVDRGK